MVAENDLGAVLFPDSEKVVLEKFRMIGVVSGTQAIKAVQRIVIANRIFFINKGFTMNNIDVVKEVFIEW